MAMMVNGCGIIYGWMLRTCSPKFSHGVTFVDGLRASPERKRREAA